jgi:MoaA/NifB/PqqE/SkfB family radical SAM enzyme
MLAELERVSVEVTNRCAKACAFCYNRSSPAGATRWTVDELVAFGRDCAAHGVRALSLGGGEPLELEGLCEVIAALRGLLWRSVTTSGDHLEELLDDLAAAAPDRVHVSVHFAEDADEVERAVAWARALEGRGIGSGVNLLVRRSQLEAARRAAARLHAAGIDNRRVIYLPLRGDPRDTPTPEELGTVAGREPFQSTSCLLGCAASPRFCSVRWDRTAAWCSYTSRRRPLVEPTFEALAAVLSGLGVRHCGGEDADVAQ